MFHVKEITTAVVTGHHEYDVVGLQALFRNMSEIDAYSQNLEDFVTDTGNAGVSNDILLTTGHPQSMYTIAWAR